MDGSREERRLERDVHLDVDVRGRERRDGDDRCAEERCVALLRHEPDERAGDFFAALLAGGHVRQDRNRDDSHVERDDGGGNRRRESESEEDVDPHPPGDGPHQQIGPTEAKEPERGGHGEDDQDVHRAPLPAAPAGCIGLRRRRGSACSCWSGRLLAGATSGRAVAGGPAGRAARPSWECWRRRRARRGPGAGAAGAARRCGRGAVVVVFRLQRDRRRAAKSLEGRDHAEDLLIGEADRRLVHRAASPEGIPARRRRSVRTSIGRGTRHRSGPGRGSSRGHRFPRGRGTAAPRSCRSCGRSGRSPCPP